MSISKIEELKHNEKLIQKLETMETQEEILAAIWSVDNYIPLYYQKMFNWYTVTYELLILNPKKELKNIFSYINEKIPRKAYSKIKEPSSMTYDRKYIGTPKQLIKWKEKLSKKQVRNILKVVQWFGLYFYTEEPEPDYKALRNWKPLF